MGGGGSSSSNYTTSTVNVDTTTIINTDELAKALQMQTKVEADSKNAELIIKAAEAQAKLNQNALFFQEVEGGIKKYAMLGGLSYVAYKIINQKPKKRQK